MAQVRIYKKKNEQKCVLLMVCLGTKFLLQMDLIQMTCLDFQHNLVLDLVRFHDKSNISSTLGIRNGTILVNWNEFKVFKDNPNDRSNVPKIQILYRKDKSGYYYAGFILVWGGGGDLMTVDKNFICQRCCHGRPKAKTWLGDGMASWLACSPTRIRINNNYHYICNHWKWYILCCRIIRFLTLAIHI